MHDPTTPTTQRRRPKPQSRLSSLVGLIIAISSIGILGVMSMLLGHSPIQMLRQYAVVPAAVAGVLMIIAGSYVLEMMVPEAARQHRLRVRLGLAAHALAASALVAAMFMMPEAFYGLGVVFLLEVVQSVRYVLIIQREGDAQITD
jgi:hypothetical protein